MSQEQKPIGIQSHITVDGHAYMLVSEHYAEINDAIAKQIAKPQTCENADRELWREREGDYYADSIHVTKSGGIGINCGGYVFVKSLREWHRLAQPTMLLGWRDEVTDEIDLFKIRDAHNAALQAEREVSELRLGVIKYDCQTEEQVKELARPIVGDFKVDGDSYGVPNEADIVESLIESFRAQLQAEQERTAYWQLQFVELRSQLQAKERELETVAANRATDFENYKHYTSENDRLKRDFAAAQAAIQEAVTTLGRLDWVVARKITTAVMLLQGTDTACLDAAIQAQMDKDDAMWREKLAAAVKPYREALETIAQWDKYARELLAQTEGND